MKILFNASQCGLGDNGGSKTIIKSAEILQELWHKVGIWAKVNNYTWDQIEILQLEDSIDSFFCDVIINVSIYDVISTINHCCRNKVWWMRGWENWTWYGEDGLHCKINQFVKAGGKIITSSGWLVDKLKSIGVESCCVWAGLDLSFWKCFCKGLYQPNREITIGGLWHPKHKTKNYHIFEQLQKFFQGNDKYKFKTLGNTLNNNQLLGFYNDCDVWLALSENEGFHQVPAEAALCGCGIIYNNIDSGGCLDYCTPETAVPYTSFEELVQIVKEIDFYFFGTEKVERMRWLLNKKIGNRSDNMKKFVETLLVNGGKNCQ